MYDISPDIPTQVGTMMMGNRDRLPRRLRIHVAFVPHEYPASFRRSPLTTEVVQSLDRSRPEPGLEVGVIVKELRAGRADLLTLDMYCNLLARSTETQRNTPMWV